jgi:hypothetical protein
MTANAATWMCQVDRRTTLPADRKAMFRLAIEAVSVNPVDVPRRLTRIKVQWTSGAVDELMVRRFHNGEYRRNPPQAILQIKDEVGVVDPYRRKRN